MQSGGKQMLRTSLRILLITLAVIFTAVQAIAINIGTAAPLPGILQRITAWPWWFVGLASLGLVALAIIDWRWEQRQSSTRTIATGGGDYAEQNMDKRHGDTKDHGGEPRGQVVCRQDSGPRVPGLPGVSDRGCGHWFTAVCSAGMCASAASITCK
jgi:membrane protein implicated in regulation of membrane protease activity